MRRWNTKERRISTLNAFGYVDPKDQVSIHSVFDLVTIDHFDDNDRWHEDQWAIIVASLELFGLGQLPTVQSLNTPDIDKDRRFTALSRHSDTETSRLLEVLWKRRFQLSRLPHSWMGWLEGHPITGRFRYRPEWDELGGIADGIIKSAKIERETAFKIDLFVLKLWGAGDNLPKITIRDIAQKTRAIVRLNELYSSEDFGLEPNSEDDSFLF